MHCCKPTAHGSCQVLPACCQCNTLLQAHKRTTTELLLQSICDCPAALASVCAMHKRACLLFQLLLVVARTMRHEVLKA
jgi:hypothetical protein